MATEQFLTWLKGRTRKAALARAGTQIPFLIYGICAIFEDNRISGYGLVVLAGSVALFNLFKAFRSN